MSSSSRMILRLLRRGTATPRRALSSTSTSTSTAALLPTRHSLQQPPRLCRDAVELNELTSKLLETPVGQLYSPVSASKSANWNSRSAAYQAADETIQIVEYLVLGHSSHIPGSLYAHSQNTSGDSSHHLDSMNSLLGRMQEEGNMYMELRHEKLLQGMGGKLVEMGRNVQEESSDSDSSSDEDSDSSSDDDEDDKYTRQKTLDFAPPGPTTRMYDAVLDGMACMEEGNNNATTKTTPMDYFHLATSLLETHELDADYDHDSNNNYYYYTLPTMVTYNAPLRGIAKSSLTDEVLRDEALTAAFSLYNSLTHSDHLHRNASSIVYMLQIVDHAIPASRVKGNMSVTFWQQASRLGVVDANVVEAIQNIHAEHTNGPEFQVLLDHISPEEEELPQRFRRFVNKYQHSKHY